MRMILVLHKFGGHYKCIRTWLRPSKIDLVISGPRPHVIKNGRVPPFYSLFPAYYYFISPREKAKHIVVILRAYFVINVQTWSKTKTM